MEQNVTGFQGTQFVIYPMEPRLKTERSCFSPAAVAHDDREEAGVIDGNQNSNEESRDLGNDLHSENS
jgi:hypothetical protein